MSSVDGDNEEEMGLKQSVEGDDRKGEYDDPSTNYGVVYLSRIPTQMNVKLVREYFQQFGSVGRIYLQPEKEKPGSKNFAKPRRSRFRQFSEGWVEFRDKKLARKVAKSLNNEQVGGRRRHPWSEEIWNIKYLPDFKWAHLNERMAYEKAVKTKRLRLEVGQAKKEAQFFADNLEFSKRLEKNKGKGDSDEDDEGSGKGDDEEAESKTQVGKQILASRKKRWEFHQKQPDEEVRAKKASNKKQKTKNDNKAAAQSSSFLGNIFTAGQ